MKGLYQNISYFLATGAISLDGAIVVQLYSFIQDRQDAVCMYSKQFIGEGRPARQFQLDAKFKLFRMTGAL